MDAKTYLKKQIKSMWSLGDSVLYGLSDDVLMEVQPGTAAPIGVIWLHMANGEDNFISIIEAGKPLWESDGWKERFGLEKAPNIGEDWTGYQSAALTVELLQAYTEVVRERTKACLETTDDGSLDEMVKFFSEADPKASVWALLVSHTLIHAGEIAAIKGVLGGKGLPF